MVFKTFLAEIYFYVLTIYVKKHMFHIFRFIFI